MLLWQPNPAHPQGHTVSTEWNAGEKTGLQVASPSKAQASFATTMGASTGQIERDVVGAYLNSRDLPADVEPAKLIITPEYRFPRAHQPDPFKNASGALKVELDLQVPTASDAGRKGSTAFIVFELEFDDQTSDAKIAYGTSLFFNGHPGPGRAVASFDRYSRSYMLSAPLSPENTWAIPLAGSASKQSAPWSGFRRFAYQVGSANFAEALGALQAKYPDKTFSLKPSDYTLAKFHLNAEIHFGGGPAELGWSMRRARITQIAG